jgi:hypothetical protein
MKPPEVVVCAGRKRSDQQRFPLVRQGWRSGKAPSAHGNSRSRLAGLLSRRNTASHRCNLPDTGRSPSVRSRSAGNLSPLCTLPLLKDKKRESPDGFSRKKRFALPTVALPTSGKGSKPLLPLSLLTQAPLFFYRALCHAPPRLSSPPRINRLLSSGEASSGKRTVRR